jgi:hypothetical protein
VSAMRGHSLEGCEGRRNARSRRRFGSHGKSRRSMDSTSEKTTRSQKEGTCQLTILGAEA